MVLRRSSQQIAEHAKEAGKTDEAAEVDRVIEQILSRPEHEWFQADVVD